MNWNILIQIKFLHDLVSMAMVHFLDVDPYSPIKIEATDASHTSRQRAVPKCSPLCQLRISQMVPTSPKPFGWFLGLCNEDKLKHCSMKKGKHKTSKGI